MAKVTIQTGFVPHNQETPNKVGRTAFTPGKATSRPTDENWPTVSPIMTGVAVVDNAIRNGKFVQTVQSDNSTCVVANTEIKAPIAGPLGTVVTQINLLSTVATPDATNTVNTTLTQNNNGSQEKSGGYNSILP